jgi:hypothetical protein
MKVKQLSNKSSLTVISMSGSEERNLLTVIENFLIKHLLADRRFLFAAAPRPLIEMTVS